MNRWLAILFVFMLSCSSTQQVEFESLDIQYLHEIPRYELNGAPFTGVAIEHIADLKIEHHIQTGLEIQELGYYSTGEKEREINYSEGKKHGSCTMWWKDGQVLLQETYNQGELDGKVIRYAPNGEVIEQKNYIKGVLDLQVDSLMKD